MFRQLMPALSPKWRKARLEPLVGLNSATAPVQRVVFAAVLVFGLLAAPVFAAVFSARTDFTVGDKPIAVLLVDLNADGKPDIVTANTGANGFGNTVTIRANATAAGALFPTFASSPNVTVGNNPSSVAAADLNGDGKPDLAVVNRADNTMSVLLNTSDQGSPPSIGAKTDDTVGSAPVSVALADLDGDGKTDLATANSNGNSVSVLRNTTAVGAFTPTLDAKTDVIVGKRPFSLAFSDINGDGQRDIATANVDGPSVSVLLNTTPTGATSPTFSPKRDFAVVDVPSDGPVSVAIGDLNGDGKPDLATANVTPIPPACC
jgi:hypothetical protein